MSADQNKSMKNFPAYIDFTHYHIFKTLFAVITESVHMR